MEFSIPSVEFSYLDRIVLKYFFSDTLGKLDKRTSEQSNTNSHETKISDSVRCNLDSEASSSVGSEPELVIKRKKKKKFTKKKGQGKATSSPLVPHAKFAAQKSSETPVKRDTSFAHLSKSSSKKFSRPENQPTIEGFLSDVKSVKKFNFNNTSDEGQQDQQKIDSTPRLYHTVSMDGTEMFLCSTETVIKEDPQPSTSTTPMPANNICQNCGKEKQGEETDDDSDIEILDVVSGKPENVGDGSVNPVNSSQKRAGSSFEEDVSKKIKVEPESIAADSTTVTLFEEEKMSDASDGAYMSDASGSGARVATPGIIDGNLRRQ